MQYLEGRKYIIQGIFLLVGLVFIARLFVMQVLDPTYKTAADRNTLQRLVQVPYRGLMYDRHDSLLVTNTPVYDLMVVPREVRGFASFCSCRSPTCGPACGRPASTRVPSPRRWCKT